MGFPRGAAQAALEGADSVEAAVEALVAASARALAGSTHVLMMCIHMRCFLIAVQVYWRG